MSVELDNELFVKNFQVVINLSSENSLLREENEKLRMYIAELQAAKENDHVEETNPALELVQEASKQTRTNKKSV